VWFAVPLGNSLSAHGDKMKRPAGHAALAQTPPVPSKVTSAGEPRDRRLPFDTGQMELPAVTSQATVELKAAELAQLQNRAAAPDAVELQAAQPATPRNAFTELIKIQQSDWRFIAIALLVAVGLGAFHALEPGHGKTLVAAYLVGSKGTIRHALLLGLIVTAAHTAGVYLLGGITLYASRYVVPEQLYPWLGLASGVIITLLGALLVMRHYRGKAIVAVSHRHDRHEHHPHAHVHPHAYGHRHDHLSHGHAHGNASLRELATLGISGGIVPCPAALVVLLGAVSINRIGFGLLLIVAFSAGLAAVLIGLGLLMVYARRFMSRFGGEGEWMTRCLPLASSVFILLVGIGLIWQASRSTPFSLI
jgi:ABC-type nickel/cobalt efflux system permease component RcnA